MHDVDAKCETDSLSTEILSSKGPYRPNDRKSPLLTANIVFAFLKRYPILQRPPQITRKFVWCRTIASDEDALSLKQEGGDTGTLYLSTVDRALDVLDNTTGTFLVVVSRTREVPDWAGRFRNRIIIVQSDDRLIYISSIIQNLFANLLVWEVALDRVVSSHGSFTELLDEGSRALGCFMAVTDGGFNDIAHSTAAEPPSNTFAQLIETGCYTPDMISHIENDVLSKYRSSQGPLLDLKRHDGEPDLIHIPVFYNGEYFFHLVMACRPDMDPYAAHDFATIFASRFKALCSTFWEDIIMVKSPWHRVFTNLIDGIPMNETYLATQLSLTAIPQATQFCLLCFDFGEGATPTASSRLTAVATDLNSGLCYPFAYNGQLLVLCYSTANANVPFSLHGIAGDIGAHIPKTPNLRTGVSRTFRKIERLHVAFAQASLALTFSPYIDAGSALLGQSRDHGCYSFDSVFPFYLLVSSMHDNELTALSVSDCMLETLVAEDKASGTEIVKLLWTYLCLERNATATSKQLNMHRNTVLYHIEKIEKRFAIDFDDPIMRTNLLDEFRTFFLTDGFEHEIDYAKFSVLRRYQERPLA